jgi:uncharacterized membrane protein YvbJ
MEEKVPCPYCGEQNVQGSNICGRCMRDIRDVANPERSDVENTAKTKYPKRSLWRRIRGWWIRRKRRMTKD